MVKTGGHARELQALADLQIGRVVAQAGKGQGAHRLPVQVAVVGAKQGVARAAVQAHVLVKQARILQRVRIAVARNDADVKLPVEHAALNAVERGHVQVQRDVACALGKHRYRLRNMRLRVAHRLVKHGHLQLAAHALVDFVHAAAKSVGRRQQLRGLGVDFLPLGRERKARAPPAAQHQPQAGFQVFDVAAHGGSANIEFELGCCHAAAIGHGAKDPQETQIHVAELAQRRPGGCVSHCKRRWRARRRFLFHKHATK